MNLVSPDLINDFITHMLGRLEKGDILTHAYTDKPGGVFHSDGTPLPGLEEAVVRGVNLDAAPGRGHINFKLAQAVLKHGFKPNTLGTDVVKLSDDQPHFYNIAAVASKFMALGLSLSEVIAAATCNPAKMLGMQDILGSLRPGMNADLSILEYLEGDFLFHDGRAGNLIPGNVFLLPQKVVKHGEVISVRESFSNHIPEKKVMEAVLNR